MPFYENMEYRLFQLTAARRRLGYYPVWTWYAGWFQLTAARRRLVQITNKETGEVKFQLTAARRRLGKTEIQRS